MTAKQTRSAAKERAVRSLLSGFGIDILVAVAMALSILIGPWTGWGEVQWGLLAFTVFKSVLQAAISYVLRLKLQPATEVDGAFKITDLPDPAQ